MICRVMDKNTPLMDLPMEVKKVDVIGKSIKGVFLSMTRQIIFLLPLILILPTFWGIDGILVAGPIADCMAGICAIVMVVLEFRKMGK